jgi:hypothetical protein
MASYNISVSNHAPNLALKRTGRFLPLRQASLASMKVLGFILLLLLSYGLAPFRASESAPSVGLLPGC